MSLSYESSGVRYDQLDAFSERVGCQRFHPLYGIVLGALCFRH